MEETVEQRLERRRREREDQKKKFDEELERQEAELNAAREKRKAERERRRLEAEAEEERIRQEQEQRKRERDTKRVVTESTLTSHKSQEDLISSTSPVGASRVRISTSSTDVKHLDEEEPKLSVSTSMKGSVSTTELKDSQSNVSLNDLSTATSSSSLTQASSAEMLASIEERLKSPDSSRKASEDRRQRLEEELRQLDIDRERRKQERSKKREERSKSIAQQPTASEILESVNQRKVSTQEESEKEEQRIKAESEKRKAEKEAQEADEAERLREEAEAAAAKLKKDREQKRQEEEEARIKKEKEREEEEKAREREKSEREASELREREAKAKLELEAKINRERAEANEAQAKREREEQQRRQEQEEQEAAAQAKREREAREKAEREKEEQEEREKAERKREELEAREKEEQEAREKAEREREEREAREKEEQEAREKKEREEAEERKRREEDEQRKQRKRQEEAEAAAAAAATAELQRQQEEQQAKKKQEEAEEVANKSKSPEPARKSSVVAEDPSKPVDREERKRLRELQAQKDLEERKRILAEEEERLQQERERRKRDREERLKKLEAEVNGGVSPTKAEPVEHAKPKEPTTPVLSAKEKREQEAKEKAAKELAAKEQADREAREAREARQRERKEREAKEQTEKEAKEQAEKEARENKARERKEKEANEKEAKEKERLEREENEKKALEDEKKARESEKKAREEEKKAREESEKKEREEKKKAKEEEEEGKKAKKEKISIVDKLKKEDDLDDLLEGVSEEELAALAEDTPSSTKNDTSSLPGTPTEPVAPKLTHLTVGRVKGNKTRASIGNAVRSLGKMQGIDISQKMAEVDEESDAKTPPPVFQKPPVIKGTSLSALFGSGNSKAAAMAAQSVAAAQAQEEVKEKRGFKPPAGAVAMGIGGSIAAAAVQAQREKKARPMSMFGTVNLEKEDPLEAKARMKVLSAKQAVLPTPGVKVNKPMLQLKGKKRTFVMQVPKLSSSLNHGDVFIMDNGEAIYIWNGSKASQVKRAKGLEVAHRIKDKEYTGRIDVITIDGMEDSKNAFKFWRTLGDRDLVKSAEEGGDDIEYEKEMDAKFKLYEIQHGSEPIVIAENSRAIVKELLKNSKVMVLDAWSEIYVWIGRNSSPEDKPDAEAFAKKLSEETDRPTTTQVHVEESLSERTVFREKFVDWKEADGTLLVKQQKNIETPDKKFRVYDRGVDARKVEKIDVSKMIEPDELAREVELFDLKHNGRGTVIKFWFCQEKEKTELPLTELGFFYSAESYVILFEFAQKNREGPGERNAFVMYFWLGKDCKISEKGTSALLAVELDRQYGAPQVRVAQGREPADFIAIFKNKMVTRTGSKKDYDDKATALFQVRGLRDNAVKAEQIQLASRWLNSGDSFVLVSKSTIYLWHGLGSFDFQEDGALDLAETIAKGRPINEITEKEEPSVFWDLLGGKEDYCTSEDLRKTKRTEQESYRLRLYRIHCAGARGNPTAEEVEHFGQKDLEPETIFIADGFFELFVWIGRNATKNVKDIRLALETAADYAEFCESYLGRLSKSTSWLIHEGYEPPTFKGIFMAWEDWDAEREEIERPLKNIDFKPMNIHEVISKYLNAQYSSAVLQSAELPFGVDAANLEEYIVEEEFASLFGVTRADYYSAPKWKQTEMKRKSGLF